MIVGRVLNSSEFRMRKTPYIPLIIDILNSSLTDKLGQLSGAGKEVSMATLRAASTKAIDCHSGVVSGVLTQYSPEGGQRGEKT